MSGPWIGVDGGGTRATCVAIDEAGVVLARRSAGPALLRPEQPQAGAAALVELIRAVADEVGADLPLPAVCCAVAGAGRSPEREALRSALVGAGIADEVLVIGDAEAALHDAFRERPGMLLIAGTGSIAWARAENGRLIRVGGWGERLGDEGSGYGIGMAALRAVARAADGRAEATALTPIVLRHAGVATAADLIAWVASAPKGRIAALAPDVIACAADDAAARGIIEDAVAALVAHVVALLRGLDEPASPPPLALAGGLIAPGTPLRSAVEAALRRARPQLVLLRRSVDGAAGAAHLARRAAG